MSTEIITWQVIDGELKKIDSSLTETGTKEYDLENWIKAEPDILSSNILIIGEQVQTKSGPLDLLGIDNNANLVVIELKRDRLPREALAQVIDYASDIATWDVERIDAVCNDYLGKSLSEAFAEKFEAVDEDDFVLSETQRMFLVGFAINEALVRMIEWLSSTYEVAINAITLNYSVTNSGDQVLSRTAIVSEEIAEERINKRRKFTWAMSDDPSNYTEEELRDKLVKYFSGNMVTADRIKCVLLPMMLEKGCVTREQFREALYDQGFANSLGQAGQYISKFSSSIGVKSNAFLRQIISYEYPNHYWEKDNYRIREGYEDFVKRLLEEIA